MFTGIVETTGRVAAVEDGDDGRRFRIETDDIGGFSHGQSVAVDGVCLTVEEHGETADAPETEGGEQSEARGGWFSVFLAEETLARTSLAAKRDGDRVNLERALPADGRLDGHVVQGHVDTTTEVVAVESVGEDYRYTFALPDGHERYVAEKGSIALDGVSLTVASVDDDAGTFDVALIPTTHAETTLGERAPGDAVNVEVDVVAKYVERLEAY
ncbi:riboflavin synthase [Halarchaeum sp. CBA1220]|uniref:riboflavin synthase n=1 Tax=Halarchaeum sp. CBA1220 TaxID=1853682 RepID=UPI000F3A8D57|nr:riboflavin synthase [Halarchaeum sp. CBA1220]QLC33616.1 riboflavin synthase [Halarchaeum sp. CBA1220]